MPTLYVENVPKDLYEALRGRARGKRRSIAAEVLALLEQNIATEKELKARREFLRRLKQISSGKLSAGRSFSPTEEMQREDRDR